MFPKLQLPIEPNQALEAIILLSTATGLFELFKHNSTRSAHATAQAGPIRTDTPYAKLGLGLSVIHGLTFMIVPLVYMGAIIWNRLYRPPWMVSYSFPMHWLGRGQGIWQGAIRLAASLINDHGLPVWFNTTFEDLDTNFSPFGLREKPRVVTTGTYAYVRHPLYSCGIATNVLYAIMFWSWVPLATLVINIPVFGYKASLEEKVLLENKETKEAYAQYQKQVPWRLVPFVY